MNDADGATSSTANNTTNKPNAKLKHLLIITRHGARFPLKPFPMDISWPRSEKFWKEYGGRLSFVGRMQHFELGQNLRIRYLHLLDGLTEKNAHLKVQAYTSSTHRTLDSLQSLLQGFFPNKPQRFAVEHDVPIPLRSSKEIEDLRRFGYEVAAFGEGQEEEYRGEFDIGAITIKIFDMTAKFEPVLHAFKDNPNLDLLQEEVSDHCPVLEALLKEKRTYTAKPVSVFAPQARNGLNAKSENDLDDLAHTMAVKKSTSMTTALLRGLTIARLANNLTNRSESMRSNPGVERMPSLTTDDFSNLGNQMLQSDQQQLHTQPETHNHGFLAAPTITEDHDTTTSCGT